MALALWEGERSRRIARRIVVEGTLTLETPACVGNGDADDIVDMPLLMDALEGIPLLTGANLAGGLRHCLREREIGYELDQVVQCLTNKQKSYSQNSARYTHGTDSVLLFGGEKGDDSGEQSLLIVDDALGQSAGIARRNGVGIAPESRTAAHDKLFDLHLWEAGTTFKLRFELLVREKRPGDRRYDPDRLAPALAAALEGLQNGEITLGTRKRRGFGRLTAGNWKVRLFDLTTRNGLSDWIASGHAPLPDPTPPENNIVAAFQSAGVPLPVLPTDRRAWFTVEAEFSLCSSLLMEGEGWREPGEGKKQYGDDIGPDKTHLHARQSDGKHLPVITGTGLGGAMRARARRIANTLAGGKEETQTTAEGRTWKSAAPKPKVPRLINSLFGPETIDRTKPAWAAPLQIEERPLISKTPSGLRTDLVQSRVSIDRFTGGALDTALFNEQPVFGNEDSQVRVRWHLRLPAGFEADADPQIGLLLLLLKDLWLEDLPLGGETGVGRGRLKGKEAILTLHRAEQTAWTITLTQEANGNLTLKGGAQETLQSYVDTLVEALNPESAAEEDV